MQLQRSLILLVTTFLAAAPPNANPAPTPRPGSSRFVAVKGDECHKTAILAKKARLSELQSEYNTAVANATNMTDPTARKQALKDAKDNLKSGIQDAQDQYAARIDLCKTLGGGPYDPVIDPAQFVAGVTNTLFPRTVGTVMTYVNNPVGDTVESVEVTNDTKTILGVTCMVVHDSVEVNGQLTEDTLDYFAQDVAGNVWYFGELSMTLVDGQLASLEGSWTAGVDGAKPGIIMEAAPAMNDTYRQEFSLGVSEDAATVLSLAASATVPFGSFSNCLETLDFSPLEPASSEQKFYVPGVGLVLEIDLETGERNELTSVTP
jgi:hypothetical protein